MPKKYTNISVPFDLKNSTQELLHKLVIEESESRGIAKTELIRKALSQFFIRIKDLPALQKIIRTSRYPTVMISLEEFEIEEVSPTLEKLYNSRRHTLVGKSPELLKAATSSEHTDKEIRQKTVNCRVDSIPASYTLNYTNKGKSHDVKIHIIRTCYYMVAINSCPTLGFGHSDEDIQTEMHRISEAIKQAAG